MTTPKVSRECSCAACSPCCMQQLPQWKRGDEHCSGCPMVSALGPEPSAVRLTKQEERLGYMMPKFKPSAVEELLRAAEQAERLLMGHTEGINIRFLRAAIAAVRRERGEEGR